MNIGVPEETADGENRVALIPDAVAQLVKVGLRVSVETGAGARAHFQDDDYRHAGATILDSSDAVLAGADLVVKVNPPAVGEVDKMREGAVLIAFLHTASNPELLAKLNSRKITAFGMEAVPRISRAQKMDALSSQASVAGYKAVLLAAAALPKYFPMLMTAAGTIAPAKVLVLGAGVAGLQAIATAKRLGAQVWGYDIRAAVKEQVESLGGKFLEFDIGVKDAEGKGGYAKELTPEQKQKQQQMLAEKIKEFDVLISTAAVPGRPAPKLVMKESVEGMKPGSVIVDLAAESGGNCELTEPGKDVVKHGVLILGPINLAATVPVHASQMYARNVVELVKLMTKEGKLNLDFNDAVIRDSCITHDGKAMKS
jgi:NAD(P) transhydrogenase subunit alpha